MGAYGYALALLGALHHRENTGEGQWIDSSQCEAGLFLTGISILDWSANGREWQRYGNRSPYRPAAPHGIYRCSGTDHWIGLPRGDGGARRPAAAADDERVEGTAQVEHDGDSSDDEPALLLRRAHVHVAAAVQMVVDLGSPTRAPRAATRR